MKKMVGNKILKKVTAAILATTFIASSGYSIYAASLRESWNNAASTTTTGTTLQDGSVVYSNVYADPTAWASWKTDWDKIRKNYEQVALTPGKDASELNFGWYSYTEETPAVRLTDSQGNVTGQTFYGVQDKNSLSSVTENAVTTNLYPNKVKITGITKATTYYYQYFLDGGWSETFTYKSQNTDAFSVLYVGDPQIGASVGQAATETNAFTNTTEYYARNDAYNWNQTLNNAIKANPKLSFILSAGDQINQTSVDSAVKILEQQVEYSGFLYPSALRSIPIATVIGNHDSGSVNYKNHFNNPNSFTEEVGASTAGNDYFFSYGDALFVCINTNNYNCQTHKDLIDKAISAYPNAKWKVLMFHQDIYGSGADHSDSDGMILRTQLTPIIDKAGFDVVLQGHDHTYSRSYQISSDSNTYTAFGKTVDTKSSAFLTQNAACYNILTNIASTNKVINPKGTVYFEANSSTGSKFYQLITTQQNYIAARSQSWKPTYSVIDINDVSLTVRTYDAATNKELVADGGIQTAYTIVKSVEKTNLESKISEATNLLSDTSKYTQDSLANLQKVIAAAKVIFDNAESNSVAVASAYTSIDDAIKALINSDAQAVNTSYVQPAAATQQAGPVTGDNPMTLYICLVMAVLSSSLLITMYVADRKKRKAISNDECI
ncbi:3',5'-cyclic AMP phosphodiesterase CpdA [[Clostridium] fimetarium]|uniref:3',5'-cyclic AMP phosphodiesterase CpdA n=2 Tax=[Clostridium] fimetarium TaxID=99656 RepID=A0A1I0PJB9_9FIRM|nr:3',5'-cyclic AMP phosphodiesterase CpdA [[Clostridium] fimetarium]